MLQKQYTITQWFMFLMKFKLEYMVISLDSENKNAKLSLRQTEILAKLSAIVDDINNETDSS